MGPLDELLRSVVERHVSGLLVVLLTGSGQDGLSGARIVKKSDRNFLIVQEPADCIDPAMPRAAIEAGLADEVVGLAELGRRLTEILSR